MTIILTEQHLFIMLICYSDMYTGFGPAIGLSGLLIGKTKGRWKADGHRFESHLRQLMKNDRFRQVVLPFCCVVCAALPSLGVMVRDAASKNGLAAASYVQPCHECRSVFYLGFWF